MSAIEVFANSKAEHGLAPLGTGRAYVPVLSTATAIVCTTYTAVLATTTDGFGGTTAFASDVGDVSLAGIPARGSAKELLDFRSAVA